MAAFVESDELARYQHLLSGSIFSKNETKALRKALKKAIFRSMAGLGDETLTDLIAHITRQVNSRRIVPSADTVGANFYTSNRRFNDGLDSVRRANNRLRGLTTTESLMREPGLYTGNDFDYLREQEEKEQKARRENNDKNTKLREHIAKIRFPEQYRQQSLRSVFGDMGMRMILAAEKDAKDIKAKSRFEDAMYDLGLSDNRREFKNLQEQFGGGEEGHKRAEQYITKRREREARREELLYKKQHPFLSKISKNMPRIEKAISTLNRRLGKIPGGGLLNKMGPGMFGRLGGGNPYLGAAMVTYGAATAIMGKQLESNNIVTGWETIRDVYGSPSKKFTRAAFYAGITDPGEIAKLFGRGNLEYGDAEQFYRTMGDALRRATDPRERTAIMQALNWNETQAELAMLLDGRHVNMHRRLSANRAIVESKEKLYDVSGMYGNFPAAMHAARLKIWGMKDIDALYGEQADEITLRGKTMDSEKWGDYYRWMDELAPAIKSSNSAAESLDDYNSSGHTNIRNGDINVSVHIDSVQDGYDLASRIEEGLGSSALRDAYEQRKNGMRA